MTHIITTFDKELGYSNINTFISHWSSIGNVRILILENDYRECEYITHICDNCIVIKNILNIPNIFIYKMLEIMYPCIITSDNKVLVIPNDTIIYSLDNLNRFIVKLNNYSPYSLLFYKSKNYNCLYGNSTAFSSIIKIHNLEGINICIMYLYKLYNHNNLTDLTIYIEEFINIKIKQTKLINSVFNIVKILENDANLLINHKLDFILDGNMDFKEHFKDYLLYRILKPIQLYQDITNIIVNK